MSSGFYPVDSLKLEYGKAPVLLFGLVRGRLLPVDK